MARPRKQTQTPKETEEEMKNTSSVSDEDQERDLEPESEPQNKKKTTTKDMTVKPDNYYQRGVNVCKQCGSKLRSDRHGKVFCHIQKEDCEMVKRFSYLNEVTK